jgi:hypothetical protein
VPEFRIPRSLTGEDSTLLLCSDEVGTALRLRELEAAWAITSPPPPFDPLVGRRRRDPNSLTGYRVVLADRYDNGTFVAPRFRLPKSAPQKTLEVIARHLDDCRIGWLHFKTSDGKRLRAPRLQAYATTHAA